MSHIGLLEKKISPVRVKSGVKSGVKSSLNRFRPYS